MRTTILLIFLMVFFQQLPAQKKFVKVEGIARLMNNTDFGSGGRIMVVKGSEWKDTVTTARISADGRFQFELQDSLITYQLFFTRQGYKIEHVQVYPELGNYTFNIGLYESGDNTTTTPGKNIEWKGPNAERQSALYSAYNHVSYFEKSMVTILTQAFGSGGDRENFKGIDLETELVMVENKLNKEQDAWLRKIYLMEYLCIDAAQQKLVMKRKESPDNGKPRSFFNATGKKEILETVMKEINPSSALWNLESNSIRWIVKQVPINEALQSYCDRVITEQANQFVCASVLYGFAQRYQQEDKPDEFAQVYTRLVTDYAGLHPANRAKAEFKLLTKLLPGNFIPEFAVTSLDKPGETITQNSLKGKTYLLEFWALWCKGCIEAMPEMGKVYKKYGKAGFEILSVALEASPASVKKFREVKHPMPWMNAYAKDGFRSDIARNFEVSWVPRSVLVGPDGKILAIDLKGSELNDVVSSNI